MNKPILFNTEMVHAILEGRKTVTRRTIKPQPTHEQPDSLKGSSMWWGNKMFLPPYQTGDVLWVRETWAHIDFAGEYGNGYVFKASDNGQHWEENAYDWKWHPSIHMPKAAARIFLKVKSVKAERLWEMTVEDALSEGVARHGLYNEQCYAGGCYNGDFETSCKVCEVPINGFEKLWNSTIKPADLDRYGWNANPWVWVISFERTEKPEDFA